MAPGLPGPPNPGVHSPHRLLPCAAVPGHVRADFGSPTPTPWARPPRLLARCPHSRRLEIKLILFHVLVCALLWAPREGTTTPHAVGLALSSPRLQTHHQSAAPPRPIGSKCHAHWLCSLEVNPIAEYFRCRPAGAAHLFRCCPRFLAPVPAPALIVPTLFLSGRRAQAFRIHRDPRAPPPP